jgi:hypothetical protein
MRVIVRLDPNRLRRWHLRLLNRLAQRPHVQLAVEWMQTAEQLPSAIPLLFALERLIYGLPDGDTIAAVAADDFTPFLASAEEAADVVLDFTASRPRAATERTWQVTFDGCPGEAAALAALVAGRTPEVAVVDVVAGVKIVTGHPGTESSGILVLAFGDLLARTATLLIAALDRMSTGKIAEVRPAATINTQVVAWFALRSLSRALAGWLYHLCYNAPHWRVGWRFVAGADVADLRALPRTGWRELPDDGHRFYADPFPVESNGQIYLFVEEFEHRRGRGVISAVGFNETGPVGTPRPVLETSFHLSYPFVFEHRGEMWMVPESCASETIDLYRGAPFPDRWIKEATLVAGIVASDATLFQHAGRWWMLATVRDDGGSHSDALYIWSAPEVLGPWVPHRRNPLLVDIASARPAGRIIRRAGRLIRPFQDCREGYGTALGLAEITRLDDNDFTQRIDTVLRPGPLWPGRRLHTLNRAGRLECIDGSRVARQFNFAW